MANIKSAKKRILVTRTRTERNKAIKSSVKTAIKKVDAAIAALKGETLQNYYWVNYVKVDAAYFG